MLNITYKKIEGYNGYYLIGSDGSIKNTHKTLKTFIINSGYKAIILTRNKTRKHFLLHRLVASYFLENTDNKKEVNHIDGNKLNNNVCNLEWVTSSENKLHAIDIGLKVYNNPTVGLKLSNKSKYHNVGWDKKRNKWKAAIRHNNKTYFQKRFDSELDAALHVNWALDELKLTDRPRNKVCS